MNTFVTDVALNKILIAAGRPEHVSSIRDCLKTVKCSITLAKSVHEVLDLLNNNEFAVMVLHSDMLAVTSAATGKVPVILISDCEINQEFLDHGCELSPVDIMTAPVEPTILRSKVQVFLELYQQKRLVLKQAELLEANHQELLKLREVNCQLESLSTMDSLTGIPNRRHFDQSIQRFWKHAQREQQPVALIMIDIDNFKAYNDTYGHLQGDNCLMLVAQTLAASVKRPNDFVGRFGGEEFVAVLPNTDKHGAWVIAERMRRRVAKLALDHPASYAAKCVTISLGVADSIPLVSNSIADLLNRADNALYLAKQHGRNKVHMESEWRLHTSKVSKKLMVRTFRETLAGLWLS